MERMSNLIGAMVSQLPDQSSSLHRTHCRICRSSSSNRHSSRQPKLAHQHQNRETQQQNQVPDQPIQRLSAQIRLPALRQQPQVRCNQQHRKGSSRLQVAVLPMLGVSCDINSRPLIQGGHRPNQSRNHCRSIFRSSRNSIGSNRPSSSSSSSNLCRSNFRSNRSPSEPNRGFRSSNPSKRFSSRSSYRSRLRGIALIHMTRGHLYSWRKLISRLRELLVFQHER